jgi:tetratricopeptide (TPR) repeat protein
VERCPICGGRWGRGTHARCGAAPARAAGTAPVMPALAGYEAVRYLGGGGFGFVFQARAAGGRAVAIKLARDDLEARARLVREREVLGRLGPPWTPALLAADALDDGTPYLVMDLVESPTLADRMAALAGPLAAPALARLLPPLVATLAAVHARGIIHRDLKPENVFLVGEARALLVDFGCARYEGTATGTGQGAGTAVYMAPEQVAGGEPTAATDVYALGVIAYELAVGRPPFFGTEAEVRLAHRGHRPPAPSELAAVPPALEALILDCLRKDPARRPSLAAFDERLGAVGDAPPGAPAARAAPPAAGGAAPGGRARLACAVVVFDGDTNLVATAELVGRHRGELLAALEGVSAAVFTPIDGTRPLSRGRRAADELVRRGLAARALVDRCELVVRTRADGARQVLGRPHAGARPLLERVLRGEVAVTGAARPEVGPDEVTPAGGPRTAAPSREPRFVGRAALLGELREAARAAIARGTSARVTVVGPDGSGRTRLARRLADELRAGFPGARVAEIELADTTPGSPEALARLAREVLDPIAPEAALAHALGRASGPTDEAAVARLRGTPGAYRSAVARAFAASMARTPGPLLVVIDDAHLADAVTLDALRLATDDAPAPVWVCLVSGRAPWREPAVALPPLAPPEAAALCRELLAPAEDVPDAAIARLVERAAGSPRDLAETCRALHAIGAIVPRARGGEFYLDTDALDEQMPPSELRRRELDSLPPELRAHAAALALLAPGFTLAEVELIFAQLQRTADRSLFPLDPGVALERLRTRGLAIEDEPSRTYRLASPLLRDALAATLAPEAARRVHAAAAACYQRPDAAPRDRRALLARLAPHVAASGDRAGAARLYLELGDRNGDAHDYVGAESMYSRALELVDDPGAELRARRARALMRYRIGRYEDALADHARAGALARAAGDRALEAELLLDEATALDWMGEHGRSADCLERARALLGDRPEPRLRVRLSVGWGRSLWRREGARAGVPELERALAGADALDEAAREAVYEDRAAALVMLVFLLPAVGRVDDAEALAARTIALCEQRGDRVHLMTALNNRQGVSMRLQLAHRAIEDLERAERIGHELGMPIQRYRAQLGLADIHRRIGDRAAARRHAELARAMERDGSAAGAQQSAAVLLVQILAASGEPALARELVGSIARAGLVGEERILIRAMELALAEADDPDHAAAWEHLLDEARAHAGAYLHDLLEQRGLAALRRGQVAEARAQLELAEQEARERDPCALGRLRAALRALEPGA